jgi:hypothetical protein
VWCVAAGYSKAPGVVLGGLDDHLSHMTETLLFLREGFDVYRQPGSAFCLKEPARLLDKGPKGTREPDGCIYPNGCHISGFERTACLNWQQLRRPYPPGAFLYTLPEAVLFALTTFSSRSISLFIVAKYLVAAHALLFLLYRSVFAKPRASSIGAWDRANPWLRRGLFAAIYCQVILWTLSGMYDGAAVAFVVLGALFLGRRQAPEALLALSIAMFLHYRALWYLPLLGFAAFGLLQGCAWAAPKRTAAMVAVSLALLGLSAAAFVIVSPGLADFPDTNPVRWDTPRSTIFYELDLLAPAVAMLGYLVSGGHWRLFAVAVCQLFITLRTPQVMPWHVLFLLPMFAVARLERGGGPLVAALVLVLTETWVVFHSKVPHVGRLVDHLLSAWGSGL